MASLLLLLLSLPPMAAAAAAALPENFLFDLASLSFRNLTLLGDSYLRSGAVGLTRDSGVPSSSTGSFLFNLPIPFFDPSSNLSFSFSTRFSFSITNPSPGSAGDGLAFFVSNPSAFRGLFNSSSPSTNTSILAVEFDTISGANHVGLDIGGLIPVKSSDLSPFGIELKSGKTITAWIEYLRDKKCLKVWAGNSSLKPDKPVLSATYDLSRYFEHSMYVGFSASTQGGTEVHTVESWSFRTFGFPAIAGHQQSSHNISNGSWSVLPTGPVVDEGKSSHKMTVLCLGIIGLVSFGIALILFAFMLVRKRMVNAEGKPVILNGLRQFRYQELSSATKGFNANRIVGTGAFGTVYRGVDPKTGVALAVKRSKKSHQSKNEFLAELSIIAGLRHKNLVQLQGWCSEKGELLLVYEFMPNGSLDKFLYNEADFGLSLALDWPRRYSVAIGIASIVTYLHEECDQQVIHRDIKTSNIMLDAHFNARLGDFGLAKLLDHDKSPDSTLTAGTMGYLAPEYLQYGRATDKSDVYSYGVVILEVCCGRRPIEVKDGHANMLINLVDWVWGLYSKDRLIEAADQRLNGAFDVESMLRLLLIGLSCVNPICTERPSMRKVLQILNHEAEPIVVPKLKPSLTFNSSAPLALQDIVLDCYESQVSSKLSD